MRYRITIWLGIITAAFILLSAFNSTIEDNYAGHLKLSASDDTLKEAAFHILKSKCNTCHRKQNPFMVFSERNMSKRAQRIYKTVFLERTMPKAGRSRLSDEEYTTLKKWLITQELF